MTNVLIVYESIEPGNIETRRVYKLLEEKGLLRSRGVFATTVTKEFLYWGDVILFVRSTSSMERNLAALAKKMGKFVILSLDDDFLSLGTSYGADGSGYWPSRHRHLKSILQQIDCLMTVNGLLAQKYIQLSVTKRYVVTNTIVEKNEIYPTKQKGINHEKIKLALYVNDGSQRIFNDILRPALRLLAEKYRGRIALYLMALHPDMLEFEGDIEIHFVPHMPYKDFKNYLGTDGFDIGLAPLTDNGFSKYKYFNKYIEYTLAGVPAIYSDCPLYRLVITDRFNGLFTDNSPEGWSDAISKLVEDATLRRTIIDNAQTHLYENFQADNVLRKVLADIPELTNYKSNNTSVRFINVRLVLYKFQYLLFRANGWKSTAINMLCQGNYKQFIKRLRTRILKRK